MSSVLRRKAKIRWLGVLLLMGVLPSLTGNAAGSFSSQETSPEIIPPAQSDSTLQVEGKLLPNRFVDLSLGESGPVEEMLVTEGELV